MNVCPTCQGKGATAPNGVPYCNCDDDPSWIEDCSHADLCTMLTAAWKEVDTMRALLVRARDYVVGPHYYEYGIILAEFDDSPKLLAEIDAAIGAAPHSADCKN